MIQAATCLYWLKDDSSSTVMRGFSITAKVKVVVLNSLPSGVILDGKLFLDHLDLSHDGPFHHKTWARRSEGSMPHEAQSASLSLVTTWPQQSVGISSSIWVTRFPMYTLNLPGFSWSQVKTMVEYVYVCTCRGKSSAFLHRKSNCASIKASFSSNLGINCNLFNRSNTGFGSDKGNVNLTIAVLHSEVHTGPEKANFKWSG